MSEKKTFLRDLDQDYRKFVAKTLMMIQHFVTSKVYDLDNTWTLDKKVPEWSPSSLPCHMNVTSIDFQLVHLECH